MNTVNAIAFGLKDTITKGYEPDIGEDYTIEKENVSMDTYTYPGDLERNY